MPFAPAAGPPAPLGIRPRKAIRWLLLLVPLTVIGCASRLESTRTDGHARFVHKTLRYTIDRPPVLDTPDWKRVRAPETDLGVRHRDGSTFALVSSCRPTRATPAQLAFHVLHASGGKRVGEETALEHRGLAGYAQTLERVEGDLWMRIRTVTLQGAECSYDFFLLAPDAARFEALLPTFDHWWQSFEPAARELGPPGASPGGGELAR